MFKTIFKYAAVLSVFFIGSTHAATIIVNSSDGSIDPNDGVCSISEAIINANDDAQTHLDCAAGSGTDTIVLTSDIVLTAAYENDTTHGSTGTPTITSPIILDGMDYAIERDTALTCNMDGTNDNDEFRLMRIGSTGNITLDSITLSNGCADGFLEPSYGGAIYNEGDLAMENSTLSDSSARYSGGIDNQGTITTIQNSTFSGNSADYGGGIYNDGNINAIQNSTFSGNSANSNGGGIYNYYGTITSLRNSLFHNNTSGGNECVNNLGTFNGANNLSDDLSGGCPGLLSTALTPSTIGPLADNGGPTWTHALLPGSEAIDAGDANSTTMDQRGMSAFGPRDIGAFEVQLSEFCPSPLQSDGFTTSVINVAELNQAIICANSNGNGTDTIELSADITLTAAYENHATHGSTGTPAITSPIILNGMDYTIERDTTLTCNVDSTNDNDEFRLMRIGSTGNITLDSITLSNGCADGSWGYQSYGGGILNEGDLAMENSTLSGNSASEGGGIYNLGDISTIENSTFSGNLGKITGGGILNRGDINTIQNSTFSGNSTIIFYGGGIYNWGDIITLQNTTFSGNSAHYGGSIINSGKITTLQNSTFSGNSSDYGAGIYNWGDIITLQNSTFSGNSAYHGDGIYNNGTITTLRNSLFHNNTGGGNECENNGTFNGTNNLSDDLSGGCPGLLTTALTSSTVGSLADNGGPTLTHALLPGSEAIDAGDANSTTMDQRGMSAFGPRDIGAFEVQLSEFCPSPLQSDGFTTSVINVAELNQAIICANSNGNGTDTIELGADITLTAAYENDTTHGSTGTPTITSPIILDGMDYAIERDTALTCNIDYTNDSSEFRLMRIGSVGNLTLNNTTLSNGCTDGSTYLRNNGGAIFNEGDLAMGNSTISGSSARVGGGISNWGTINTIQNNTFSGNSAVAFGGGIYNDGTITTIQNSTLSGNSAYDGGGIYNFGNISTIENSTLSGNSANANGGGVYNDNGIINTLQNSLFHNNTGGGNECENNGTFNGANNLTDDLSGGCPGLLSTALTPSTIGSLADNGGPTLTHALLPGSEAIDMGDGNSTATDQRGFTALGDRDIGAFEAQPPVVTAPADVNVEATGPLSSPALGTATVIDIEEPGLVATPSMTGNFPLGTTVVTWTTTDSYGFVGSDTQNVTIADTTPPVVTPPADINMEATANMTPVSVGTATATDLVDGSLTPTSNAPASFPLGTTTVTWSATDASGNTGTATQSVTIVDTTPPVITITGSNPMHLNIGDTYTEAGATAVDLVDGTVTAVASGSVNTAVAGSYNITYQASDNQGNSSQAIRVVNVGVVRSFTGLLPSGQSGTLSFTSSDPNCSFISMPQFLNETSVTPAPQSQLIFLDGVVSFTIDNCAPGATVDMTMDYNQNIGPEYSYWKSGSPWFELPSTISGSSVSFSITDDATGDADGSVDGSITDPSGLATIRAPAIPVPAGHLWAWLILIGLMLAGLGHQARKQQLM